MLVNVYGTIQKRKIMKAQYKPNFSQKKLHVKERESLKQERGFKL
jgi:hypothetical protein